VPRRPLTALRAGEETTYKREQQGVDSVIDAGSSSSWNSVLGHLWRVYDLESNVLLGGLTVEHDCASSPCCALFGVNGWLASSLQSAVEAKDKLTLLGTLPQGAGRQSFVFAD